MNSVTAVGTYQFTTSSLPANTPPSASGSYGCILKVEYSNSDGRYVQTVTYLRDALYVYKRTKGTTGWKNWVEVTNNRLCKVTTYSSSDTYDTGDQIINYTKPAEAANYTYGVFLAAWGSLAWTSIQPKVIHSTNGTHPTNFIFYVAARDYINFSILWIK